MWKAALRLNFRSPWQQHLFCIIRRLTLIIGVMGSTWGQPWADRTQVGPTLAPWILLSGYVWTKPRNICLQTFDDIYEMSFCVSTCINFSHKRYVYMTLNLPLPTTRVVWYITNDSHDRDGAVVVICETWGIETQCKTNEFDLCKSASASLLYT